MAHSLETLRARYAAALAESECSAAYFRKLIADNMAEDGIQNPDPMHWVTYAEAYVDACNGDHPDPVDAAWEQELRQLSWEEQYFSGE